MNHLRPVNWPFYFAIPHTASAEQRAMVPGHIGAAYGVWGRIEFVRRDERMRLYRVVAS